jgi:hypothetical protein
MEGPGVDGGIIVSDLIDLAGMSLFDIRSCADENLSRMMASILAPSTVLGIPGWPAITRTRNPGATPSPEPRLCLHTRNAGIPIGIRQPAKTTLPADRAPAGTAYAYCVGSSDPEKSGAGGPSGGNEDQLPR